jgi:hypothetical protein
MSKEIQIASPIENALMRGDLSKLNENERLSYYKQICTSLGLNPLTKPMEYITLNGKLVLYATKGCTEQLRNVHKVSLKITSRESIEGVYVVTAEALLPDGRCDSATGAVSIGNLKGEALANAFMKAETKAKRRVTLSLLGLNMLDESEVEGIPAAEIKTVQSPKPPLIPSEPCSSTAPTMNGKADMSQTPPEPVSDAQVKSLEELRQDVRKLYNEKGWSRDQFIEILVSSFAKNNANDLTRAELESLLEFHA